MRRVLFILFTLLLSLGTATAQNPSWAKKVATAVFTLKTFKADGALLASGNGFFISEQGEAVSGFTPFKGAQRAVVIDTQGKEWPVDCIIGANEMYDVAKFHVDIRKSTALSIAASPAASGTKIWLMPYAANKTPACKQGDVSMAERFQEKYTYYTMTLAADDQYTGCPVLNEAGEAIGLMQPASGNKTTESFAVGVGFAADLQARGLSVNDPALRSTAIAKAIPEDYDEALLSMYMAVSVMDQQQYADYVERFIQRYPDKADGYVYRARLATAAGRFAEADADLRQAVKVSDKKDEAHFQYAQIIYQKELLQGNQPYEGWSLELALEESKEAYKANPQPIYRQQQAQILYMQQKFAEAFAIYEELAHTDLRSADNFFAAAQCKMRMDDKKGAMTQMDSAVAMFSRPYVKTAAPYLRVRAQLSMETRRYQQAINDMNDLVALEPNNAELWAEKASYELRVNLLDQALESAQECLRLDPTGSDGYLMTGISQCLKGDKQEGIKNLNKAKELGNDQAQTFIDKYQ